MRAVVDEERIRIRARWTIALRYCGLSPTTRLVALAASTWMDYDGQGARPGVDAICEATDLARRSVYRSLSELEAAGWIRREGGGGRGRASTFSPLIPAWADAIVEQVLSGGRNGATAGTDDTCKGCRGRHGSHEKGCQVRHERVPSSESPHARNGATGGTPALRAFQEPDGVFDEGSEPPWVAEGISWPEFLRRRREAEAPTEPLTKAAGA